MVLRYFKGQSEVEHFSLKPGVNALAITALVCKRQKTCQKKKKPK